MTLPLTDETKEILRLYSLRVKAPQPSRKERGYRIFWTANRPWRLMAQGLHGGREIAIWLLGYAARVDLMKD
jgi:hypothetical protein